MLSREKPLVKPMAPESLFRYIKVFSSVLSNLVYYFAIFTFQSIHQKYQKYLLYYLYQISLLRVTVKGLTTPLSCWLHVFDCLCRYSVTCASSPTGLIPWFSKLMEILTLCCCITLSSSREKPTQAQEVESVCLGRGPEKSCRESLADQGSSCGMMTA